MQVALQVMDEKFEFVDGEEKNICVQCDATYQVSFAKKLSACNPLHPFSCLFCQ